MTLLLHHTTGPSRSREAPRIDSAVCSVDDAPLQLFVVNKALRSRGDRSAGRGPSHALYKLFRSRREAFSRRKPWANSTGPVTDYTADFAISNTSRMRWTCCRQTVLVPPAIRLWTSTTSNVGSCVRVRLRTFHRAEAMDKFVTRKRPAEASSAEALASKKVCL